MQDLAGTANLSAGITFWTPKSSAPVEFSATPVGRSARSTSPPVAPRDRRRRRADGHGHQRRPSPACRRRPADAARAYGNAATCACASGQRPSEPHVARLRAPASSTCSTRTSPTATPATCRPPTAAIAAATPCCRRRRRRSPPSRRCDAPSRSPASTASAATSGARSTPTTSRFAPATPARTRGQPYTLSDVEVDVTLPAVMLKGLYGEPAQLRVAARRRHRRPAARTSGSPSTGANTVEGVQVLEIDGPLERPLHRSRRGRRQRRRALPGRRAQLRAAGLDLDADGRRADLRSRSPRRA